jgi:hypothetical protein
MQLERATESNERERERERERKLSCRRDSRFKIDAKQNMIYPYFGDSYKMYVPVVILRFGTGYHLSVSFPF